VSKMRFHGKNQCGVVLQKMTSLKQLKQEIDGILKRSGCTIGLRELVTEKIEGFEKELREMLEVSERMRTSHMVIKEILGVE